MQARGRGLRRAFGGGRRKGAKTHVGEPNEVPGPWLEGKKFQRRGKGGKREAGIDEKKKNITVGGKPLTAEASAPWNSIRRVRDLQSG